jgi:Asp-tRNA(Asn)/Glu-tRNA(Gln) amidotransferase A subunit family amidase
MYLADGDTVTANLAGIPGISIPVGVSAIAADRYANFGTLDSHDS